MRVRYTPEAFADRERIFEYLGERSPGGVRNVMASIREAVTLLSDQPYSGYRTNDPDVLVKFVARYPYKIFVNTQPFLVAVNSDAAPSSGDPFRVARMASRTPMARRRAVSMTDRMSA